MDGGWLVKAAATMVCMCGGSGRGGGWWWSRVVVAVVVAAMVGSHLVEYISAHHFAAVGRAAEARAARHMARQPNTTTQVAAPQSGITHLRNRES